MHPMENVFSLPVAARADFIQFLLQSFGCSYICLWAYDSISPNRLCFLDGIYNVTNDQPGSSLGTVAQQLFRQFRTLTFDVNDDRVPGLAFRNQRPYLELQRLELLRLASTEIQTQFFQEARIKSAVFMGCNKGEIELGFLNMSQVDIQTALRSLFPGEFSTGQSQQIDQNPPTSSSSSLRSISTGSPEYSSLLFSIPGTSQSHFPETLGGARVLPMQPVPNTATGPHQQAIEALAQAPLTQFPTPETEHYAIMRAILHVISPTSHHHQNLPFAPVVHPDASAFQRYRSDIGPNMASNIRKQSFMKRSLTFFRNLNFMRMRERIQATSRPTNTQLHHMISERRRREKLNENFQALRALLPPGTKKDKASILIAAKDTLSSLMAEVDQLSKRNEGLTSFLPSKEPTTEESKARLSPNERLSVRVSHVPESSSSQERMVELQVNVRAQVSQIDLSICLLEFLKQCLSVSLVSMDANTHIAEGNNNVIHQLTFRLRIIQGSDWDECTFEEAVRRVVGDLAQYQEDQ
ncbi:putative transcription factor bHLH041 isoform X1 [Vigna unguiculata]|uniref:putative transcription factor bHLH041 isoform X1 n=1 Tax=Vigna unguiculata TaxID=3917 RepID=UPI0010162774|nr:putative transcription factor bHLH041 isoform X1 [Vigna unguiculata]